MKSLSTTLALTTTLLASSLALAAEVGSAAPAFELPGVDGKTVKLSDHRGKTVVLEWINPDCPFVKNSHGKASLKGLAKKHAKNGVVWLAINSNKPGSQGSGLARNQKALADFGLDHPLLLDETGKVGKAYGATNTPHMYVVDKSGTLVYAGAIDNAPDGGGEFPRGGKLVNYVDEALSALAAGKPVSTPSTKAYGCNVKY